MNNDLIYFGCWWVFFLILGIVSIPLVYLFFKKFIDIGYGFAKTIGLLLISYFAFILSIFKILPLQLPFLYLIFAAYLTLNIIIFKKNRQSIVSQLIKKRKVIIAQEILFSTGLLFWSYIRAHQPDIRGLEKFMDFGFINSILRSNYLPPSDMWFAGQPINYYWFGHFSVAVATKISNIPSSVTYNLMLATILGLILTMSFSLVGSIFNLFSGKIKRLAFAAGIISAILLAFGGNFHTPTYLLKEGADKYWYPDATRFIGYNPEVDDKTIHEFPLYSFVVSDLHAHLINLPYVILFLAFLFRLAREEDKNTADFISKIAPVGFLIGIFFMTNAWDFANYLLAAGVVIGLFSLQRKGLNIKAVVKTAISICSIFLIAALTLLPFLLNFNSIAQGVKLVHTHTPLWQLAILWGFPFILTCSYIAILFPHFKKIKKADLFIVSLLIVSWILIFLPEIIFVKDIYIASHYRANTMFKLTYQAFVMFYISSGYIAVRVILHFKDKYFRSIAILFFSLIFFLVLLYPRFAINSYYGRLKNYQGLSGNIWLKTQFPEEYEIVDWFNKNVAGQPVILEAPGDSYTDYNAISSYTGLPTVSGWFVHEWLWRGDSSFPQKRVEDIVHIYTSNDIELTKMLLDKYKVKYVIVGSKERKKYSNIDEGKFVQIGEKIFASGNASVYQLK